MLNIKTNNTKTPVKTLAAGLQKSQQSWLHTRLYLLVMCLGLFLVACASAPTKENANPQKAAEAHTAIAAQYVKRGNLDSAKRHAEQAIEAYSRFAEAHNIMAVILHREGSDINLKKAEKHFERAIDLKSDFAQAHNNYGVYLSQLNRNNEAIEQFEIAGAMLGYLGRRAALENLGRTALKINNVAKAERAFLQALDVNRNSLIAKVELVDIYLQKNKINDAQRFYDDYVNFLGGKPQGSRSLWQGVRIANALKDAVEVKRLGDKLMRDHPTSIEANRFRVRFLRRP